MPQTAIEARGLVMRYGDREVLHGIDLVVQQGMVLGFLGPNGAGKTTTIEILEGYRRRTAGHASVLGMDPATGGRELRERIGIVLQETTHNPDFTVRETVRRFAGYYRRPRPLEEVIGLVELQEAADRRVRVAEGTPADLAAAQHVTEIRFTLPADAVPGDLPRVSGAVLGGGREVEVSTKDPTGDLLALTSWAAGRGISLDGLSVARPSLEDIYLALTSDKEATA